MQRNKSTFHFFAFHTQSLVYNIYRCIWIKRCWIRERIERDRIRERDVSLMKQKSVLYKFVTLMMCSILLVSTPVAILADTDEAVVSEASDTS